MNDLKLINVEKVLKRVVLLTCTIMFMLTSCRNRQAKVLIAADTVLLPITYVTKIESENRQYWFLKHKYPVLDSITWKYEGVHETEKLDFKDLDETANLFDSLIVNRPSRDTTTGVRVYYASQTLKPNGCGKLTLIFTATAGIKNADVGNYYAFKNGVLDTNMLDIKTAKAWVENYQLKKRIHLKYTMDTRDTCKEETKYIWFSLRQIKSIIAEVKYQKAKHPTIVNGFGVRFTSYTDQDYMLFPPKPIQYYKRLTIGFTFLSNNKDIGIEDIDPKEFKERFEATRIKVRFIGDTFDTGVPAPPPSDTKEALDSPN